LTHIKKAKVFTREMLLNWRSELSNKYLNVENQASLFTLICSSFTHLTECTLTFIRESVDSMQ